MRILISPAKKMVVEPDGFPVQALPQFIGQAERLRARLLELSYAQLRTLWRCSDRIAGPCYAALQHQSLRQSLTPAILSFQGIQYQYMAPGVFSDAELHYVQEHVRILSGFYGLLRPLDGVTPYRLEMQARLEVDGCRDLYAFWGGRLARQLAEETRLVVDLASREYSKSVLPHLPADVRTVTCVFGTLSDGRVLEQGTQCKMARGEMVRYLADCGGQDVQALRGFDRLRYVYCPERSDETRLVFLRPPAQRHGGRDRDPED